MLSARGILAVLAAVFLLLGCIRMKRGRGLADPAVRTWLIIGVTFGAVSAWLYLFVP